MRESPDTDLASRLQTNDRLSTADVAALALADDLGATAVMDEQYGRDVADTEGIETRGTAFLILSLLRDEKIDSREAREILDAMVEAGWYCSTGLYARIVKRIDGMTE